MLLNDLSCKNAKPRSKPYKLNDGEGLWLYINPNGKKYWRFNYKYSGKENRLSFGAYPIISLAEARTNKVEALATLSDGKNPSLIRQEQKQLASYNQSQTFEALAREWHGVYIGNWTPKTAARVLRRLEKEMFPDLGQYPIAELSKKVFFACLQKAAYRSAELGKRLFGHSKQIFEYAGLTGRLDKDLTVGVKSKLPKYRVQHFLCIETEDLSDLLKAMFAEPPESNRMANQALKLVMLFACRAMELIHAERTEFNLEKAVWIVPSTRVKKAGEQRNIKRDHIVPLSRQAIGILTELDKVYGDKRKFLFPSPLNAERSCSHGLIRHEIYRIGYKSKMTVHGFRSLFMTISTQELNFKDKVPDRQLGHVPKSEIMRAYDRAKYLPQRTKLMQRYADHIYNQLLPKTQTSPERIKNAEYRFISTIGNITPTSNFYGYSPRIGYRIPDLAKTMEGGQISSTS